MPLTKEQFAIGLAPVLAVWHKEQPPAATLKAYHQLLAHIPFEIWKSAALETMLENKFFPKPAEFIDCAVRAVMAEQQLSEPWARQWLDEQRAEYLALASGHRQIGDGA